MNVINNFENNIVILDGAMGTMLQDVGLKICKNPEDYNITNKDKIEKIHKLYVDAGSNIILTNTFGANDVRLETSSFNVYEIVKSAVEVAKKATYGTDCLVALDIGPLGKFIKPKGDIEYKDAVEIFKKQIKVGVDQGVDLIMIETMMDLEEMKAAIIAAKEITNKPIFATMTFNNDLKTIFGYTINDMVNELEKLGVNALGFNCSTGPKDMVELVKRARSITKLPIVAMPNIGKPKVVEDKLVYDITKEEFLKYIKDIVKSGANIVGGCCGTTPEFISELYKNLNKK
ncbi:homocysteine S-methyltransferase family protein [Clostridium sp. Ade.TY]|uniref:homocysteine S-methyltransferase family protein n=1 Tax=Clostridium sp. Ade.TY TaxID=1391647 RepID=UPI0004266E9B|nr:homocysteine S-methyltransferase family protein [Clostridium sp. Ade.TY]